jgi:hypothetical protein
MLGMLDRRGKLHRLWWPCLDGPQHVEKLWAGLLLPGIMQVVSWLHQQPWQHEQSYDGDTAILRTVARSTEWRVEEELEDAVIPGMSVWMRRIIVRNKGN